jgi:hypothetical protein
VVNHRKRGVRSTGYQQGGFGQSVDRDIRLRAETSRREGVGKPLQSRGTHRLRTTHGGGQARQIECRTLLRVAVFDAEVVGEVRRDGKGGAMSGDGSSHHLGA